VKDEAIPEILEAGIGSSSKRESPLDALLDEGVLQVAGEPVT
jgi:hypothetical protein